MFNDIAILNRRELPGRKVYNRLALAIRHLRSLSPFLDVSMGVDGGLQFDFVADAALDNLLSRSSSYAALPFALHTRLVPGDKYAISGGHVRLPGITHSIAAVTDTAIPEGGAAIWLDISRSSAAIATGADLPELIGESTIRWPLAVIDEIESGWSLVLLHAGDVILPTMPAVLIPGYGPGCYRATDAQGAEIYITPVQCQTTTP